VTDLVLEQLVDLLAERLAPKVAAELAALQPAPPAQSRLLSLDEFVTQLPAAKSPETWKRWLYDYLRRGEVAGAVKLGGFVDPGEAMPWLLEREARGTTTGTERLGAA
jgi:hypothetical protein